MTKVSNRADWAFASRDTSRHVSGIHTPNIRERAIDLGLSSMGRADDRGADDRGAMTWIRGRSSQKTFNISETWKDGTKVTIDDR